MTDDRSGRSDAKRGPAAGIPASPPLPARPLTELSPAELRAAKRNLDRWMRDRQIAAGRKAPRTMREVEIWENSVRVLRERLDGRAAGVPEDELPPLPYDMPPGPLLPFAERVTKRARRARERTRQRPDAAGD